MVYHKINCESCGGSYESKHIKRHCETSKHKFSLLSSEDQKIITEEKIQTQKEKDNEMTKEWQNNNKDKMKEYSKKYYETNKEKCIDASKKYYEKNKEKIWAKMYNKILPN
jgi:TRAP-type C4-dicarboxylate transport system substrate-binding protein